jgi:dual-specificity kinase
VVRAEDQIHGTLVAIKIGHYRDDEYGDSEHEQRIMTMLETTPGLHTEYVSLSKSDTYAYALWRYFAHLLGTTEHRRHPCLILPLYGKTLGAVLRNNSLRPLPLRHIREIAFQIIRGVNGNILRLPMLRAALIWA